MATIELRLFAGVHLYYEFIDDNGERMTNGQINGLSTDITTGAAIPIGGEFDPNDVIMMYSDHYLNSPIFGNTTDIDERSGTVIFNGTEAEVLGALNAIKQLENYINAQQLAYNPTPGENQYNSNSVANTVWNVLGQLLTLPSGSLDDNRPTMLTSEGVDKDVLQGNAWSPNIDGSNIIGSIVSDAGETDQLIGTAGEDELYGLEGNDTLIGREGNDYLDGGDDFDTADYSNAAEMPEGTNKTLGIQPTQDGISVLLDNYGGIDFEIQDRYGDIDELFSVEKVIGQKGANNEVIVFGNQTLDETSPNHFEFNGINVELENFTRFEGDSDDQTFNLDIVAGRIIEGNGGTDTVDYSGGGAVINPHLPQGAERKIYDITTGLSDTLLNIENVAGAGTLPDEGGNLDITGMRSLNYSMAQTSATYTITTEQTFDSDPFPLDQIHVTYRTEAEIVFDGGGTHEGVMHSGNFTEDNDPSYIHQHLLPAVASVYIRGTDFGDTVEINPEDLSGAHHLYMTFESGSGNDTIVIGEDTGNSSLDVWYRGGNDVIECNGNALVVQLWGNIRLDDVTAAGDADSVTLTIAGHGTLILDDYAAGMEVWVDGHRGTITINSNGTISKSGTERDTLALQGTWHTDNWAGDADRNETFYAKNGNDVLNGGGGDDVLWGGDGNDTLYALSGTAELYGGDGDDIYHASEAAVTLIDDTEGVNTLNLTDFTFADYDLALDGNNLELTDKTTSQMVLQVGNLTTFASIAFAAGLTISGEDLLLGGTTQYVVTSGNDSVNASFASSSRYVNMLGGDDNFTGSSHADVAWGDSGEDTMFAGDGGDYLYGEADDDSLFGQAGDDFVFGGDGNDNIGGGAGDDVLNGGEGSDLANYYSAASGVTVDTALGVTSDDGDGGEDILVSIEQVWGSNNGGDILRGSSGADILQGMAGDDTMEGRGGNDSIWGGSGNDTVSYASAASGITASLASGTATGDGSDTFNSIENLVGSNYADTLTGDSGVNMLQGGDGEDVITGGDGDDDLQGGTDDDEYIYSSGDGEDTIADSDGEDDFIRMGAGILEEDIILTQDDDDLVITFDGVGGDEIRIVAQYIDGTGQIEKIIFDDLSELILPGYSEPPIAETDTFTLLKNVTFYGNVLTDNGNGFDSDPADEELTVTSGTFSTVQGGSVTISTNGDFSYTAATNYTGSDSFTYTLLNASSLQDTGTVNIQVVVPAGTYSSGNNILYVTGVGMGHLGNDIMHGTASGNTIYGGMAQVGTYADGNDTIYGQGGDDNLRGEEGNDRLYGGDGDDSLNGEEGVDFFDGGNGFDRLDFNNGATASQALSIDVSQGIILNDGFGNEEIFTNIEEIWVSNLGSTVIGSSGNDRFVGANGVDIFYGNDGQDELIGFSGDDALYGGDGKDLLQGGWGEDILYGGDGDDKNGYVGGEYYYGGVEGGDDNDTLYGGAGDDSVKGAYGDDILYGDAGNDYLYGEEEDDYLAYNLSESGGNTDVYYGNTGFDTLRLYLTSAEYADQDILDEISAFESFLSSNQNTSLNYGNSFSFTEFALTVNAIEALEVYVDNELQGGGQQMMMGGGGFGGGSSFMMASAGGGSISYYPKHMGDFSIMHYGGKALMVSQIDGNNVQDIFYFSADRFEGGLVDTITNFDETEGDALDFSDIFEQEDVIGEAIADYIQATQVKGNTILSIDKDGIGTEHEFSKAVVLANTTGIDIQDMIDNGNITV